jgi:CheY-like chemotaxis protein
MPRAVRPLPDSRDGERGPHVTRRVDARRREFYEDRSWAGWVSEVGGGSLPEDPVAARGASAREAARGPARILLVDDIAYVREALGELLRTAGYQVTAVGSGPAALAEIDRQGTDLLLTDLYMPEMNGWDLVRAVRARNVTNARGLPVCVGLYSAVLSGFSREQLARAQVDFAVTKLSDPEAVLDSVERALAWSEVR